MEEFGAGEGLDIIWKTGDRKDRPYDVWTADTYDFRFFRIMNTCDYHDYSIMLQLMVYEDC